MAIKESIVVAQTGYCYKVNLSNWRAGRKCYLVAWTPRTLITVPKLEVEKEKKKST